MIDLGTAFVLGLVGSLHCAGMCGPLAIALPIGGGTRASFFAGRFAYNAGRIITYCGLGLVFGLIGRSLVMAGLQQWGSISLGVILLVGLFTSYRVRLAAPLLAAVQGLKNSMAVLLKQRSLTTFGLLGLANGLLPCGLVYVAGAAAAATGGVLSGALYMAAFGLGTVPMMLVISLSGSMIPFAFRLKLRKVIPVSVVVLASILILRGMGLGIPYLSPNLSTPQATAGSCCNP